MSKKNKKYKVAHRSPMPPPKQAHKDKKKDGKKFSCRRFDSRDYVCV